MSILVHLPLKGRSLISHLLPSIPESPGVYKMYGDDKLLYIGKAKNLRNRLASYARELLSSRIASMVSLLDRIEYVLVGSETEALLLEANLVKALRPQYNLLLQDGKLFPYIKITIHKFPQIVQYRGRDFRDGSFFGPFVSTMDIKNTIFEIQKIFKLRVCSDQYFASRRRPCIQYQIKRCSAPCVGKISESDYNSTVKQAIAFLRGDTNQLKETLISKMQEYSDEMLYEKAAETRDRIKAISTIAAKYQYSLHGIESVDIVTITSHNNTHCIQVFLYRNQQNYGNAVYYLDDIASESEALESFLVRFYIISSNVIINPITSTTPSEILVNVPISSEIQKIMKASYATSGIKQRLIEQAEMNGKIALLNYINVKLKHESMFVQISEMFGINDPLYRIEIYDNSHLMGTNAVGVMVVATLNGFDKREYRKFNIKSAKQGDDYGMLREVLQRRMKNLKIESKPGLIIIDGGKGHLSVAKEIVRDIPLVCMAKGPERNGNEEFWMEGRNSWTLSNDDPVMRYLQLLRDEAHNYAIRSHRKSRTQSLKISSLDKLKSIGVIRKKRLLQYFGSFKAVNDASIEQITQVAGFDSTLAIKIFNQIHGIS